MLSDKIKSAIRDVNDFPKPGIIFKDITPVFHDPGLVREMVVHMAQELAPLKPDAIAAVEARGFIFGAILAHELGCKFVPIRKAGKLPHKTKKQEYQLEYGTAAIEMHEDAVQPGWNVIIHDDLLATGGTAIAAANLISNQGAHLAGFSFIVNLKFLPGEQNLMESFGVKPHYLVSY